MFDPGKWKISNEKVENSFLSFFKSFYLFIFKNIPKQNRNKDCGVFMLFYAKCLADSQEINKFTAICP
jgi:hypothetical protein